MGYLSNVTIIVSKEGYNELNRYVEYLVSTQKEVSEEGNYLKLADRINADLLNDTVEIVWRDFKWYSGYKGVQAIEEGLEHLKAYGFSYEYGIIGEEEHDIEIEHETGSEDTKLPTLYVRRTFDTFW